MEQKSEIENKKKVILVTGGAGFIGSHLCEALAKDPNNRVISLDNYFTGSKDNHVDGVEYRDGHTKDIEKYITETPDIIYHLGEYPRVAESIEEPEKIWDLNMLGTFAVLEFWRKNKCKLVYAGSSTKFATPRPKGVEAAEVEGSDLSPYTWAKATNTDLVNNYSRWYGLSYATVYFSNVYGPRERSDQYGTVIEKWRQKYLKGEPLEVRLPGTQTRNYTHVYDTISGLLLIGEKGEGDGYNIAAEEVYGTKEVAEMFGCEMIMLPARRTSRPSAVLDTTRLKELGWKQTKHLKNYIEEIKKEKNE